MGDSNISKKAGAKMSLTVVCAFLVLVVSCLFLSACGGGTTTYRVLLLDEDGITVLYADSVEAGTSITDIKTPTKASDERFNYEFTGWVDDSGKDVILAFINQDITAYAKYKQVERQYDLQIVANGEPVASYDQVEVIRDGMHLTTGSYLRFGDKLDIKVNGTDGYTIEGSISYSGLERVDDPEGAYYMVVGDVTISYNETPNQYTVRLLNYDGTQLYTTLAKHGQGVSVDIVPTREADLRATYVFDGWADLEGDMVDLTRITGPITAYAHYREVLIDYILTINNYAQVSIFNGDIELFDGSTIHYNDQLRVVVDTTEGYHMTTLTANSQDISSNGTFKVTGNMTVEYAEEINSYAVALFDDDRTTSLHSSNATHGSSVTVADPSKEADETYTYAFVGWYDATGVKVDLTNIKSNITAYAKYEPTYIEYALTMTDRVEVTTLTGEVYTSESQSPTLHYGDVVLIEYLLADGFDVNKFNVTGATLSDGNYIVNGAVNIEFAMEKTFSALKYDNLLALTKFSGTSGDIELAECTDNGSKYTYKYVGLEAVDYAPVYEEFLTMQQVKNISATYTPEFDQASKTLTTNADLSRTAYITTPLYKGMTVEFTISGSAPISSNSSAFIWGLSEQSYLDDASTWNWYNETASNYANYQWFSAQYNFYAAEGASNAIRKLVSGHEKDTANSTSTGAGSRVAIATSTLADKNSYTIRLVLNDALELYIDGVKEELNFSGLANYDVRNYNIADDTEYYLSFATKSVHTITINEFGYVDNSEYGYLQYLSGKTITLLGDSITEGFYASDFDRWEEYTGELRYSTILASELGMIENNMGEAGTVYVTGTDRTSRLDDVDSIPLNSEIIVVALGINDFYESPVLGELGSTDTTTLYGATDVMYSKLQQRFTDINASIFICTPTPPLTDLTNKITSTLGYTFQDLCDVIIAVAEKYDFQVVDLYNDAGLVDADYSYHQSGHESDTLHPGDSGHDKIAQCIYDAVIEYGRYIYTDAI